MERWQSAGFALYVHWPFCQAKCPYCDFNSHVSAQVDHDAWRSAFVKELGRLARETPDRVLSSIFFGGGTPSLLPADTVAAIIDEATHLWSIANDIEITLEANPTSVESDKLKSFRTAGVNRVSIGVQALNDVDLRRLGRMHNAAEARHAISVAQSTFDRMSFDLIYARQHQTLRDWEAELTDALSMSSGHLSLYQLTVEPDTVFGARYDRGQLLGLPHEDLAADMYLLTQDLCDAHGLPAYEVSNHAAPGLESRHNTIYWRAGDYVGVGPGAHGRITDSIGRRFCTECPKSPNEWLNLVLSDHPGELTRETLDRTAQATEFMVMGLRLTAGIDVNEYASIAGANFEPQNLQELTDLGLITVSDQTMRTTLAGRMVLNSVLQKLLADR